MDAPLIGAVDLIDLILDDREMTLLDVRYRMGGPGGRDEFARGHIPGAAYVDLDADLAGTPGERGRHPLPEPDVFGDAMRRAGVGRAPVVVYDDWEGRAAARCWWLLRYHGCVEVQVLDGGWPAWQRAGGAIQAGPSVERNGTFAADPGRLPVLEAADVLAFAEQAVLIDARNPERYRGEVEPVDPVAGHIPGAVNVPTGTNLRDDGTFRSPAELRAAYPDAAEIGVYCGSGVTAAHDLLALAYAGIDAVLYPGSWSEWVADPSNPVATGPEPVSNSPGPR
ncbi:MAG TPA: sulfurtransferase [Marmoricola sp.]|jgi:thiosulfate/3-mercaptopyruvate sulfurtransferase|nr:sulfurtransferase [Marmoricola sp.]